LPQKITIIVDNEIYSYLRYFLLTPASRRPPPILSSGSSISDTAGEPPAPDLLSSSFGESLADLLPRTLRQPPDGDIGYRLGLKEQTDDEVFSYCKKVHDVSTFACPLSAGNALIT
jgi:hypothetical protein